MKISLVILVAALVGVLSAAIVIARPEPPSTQLLKDIDDIRKQVVIAEADVASSGGLIGVENRIRLATLQSTEAMLQQRRLAWLHGIDLRFPNARPGTLVSSSEVSRIESSIKNSEESATAADVEAEQYSGGLLQSMILVRSATERATVAQLRQQLAYARSREPLPSGNSAPGTSAPPSAPGKTTSDKDAL